MGKKVKNAYRYCSDERRIHPSVISDSWLGVVPKNYSVSSAFAIFRAEAEEAAEKMRPETRKKTQGISTQEILEQLSTTEENLAELIKNKDGWLAFFYTDASHRIVSIRFRKPFSSEYVFFKPTIVGGVFNHGLFSRDPSQGSGSENRQLLVFEGEFNQLQYQSLLARVADAKGRSPQAEYAFACSVGGVHNVDARTVQRLCRLPVVWYDNDASGAGFELVNNLLRVTAVKALTTRQADSDADSFICDFRDDYAAAHSAVKALQSGAQLFVRPFDAVQEQIDDTRRQEGKGGLRRFEVNREAANILVEDLRVRGRFYHDARTGYVFLDAEKQLLPIELGSQHLELLLSSYGLAPSEPLFRYVLDELRLASQQHGTLTEVYTFTHYDRPKNTLYVSNFGQEIYRITVDAIETVDNGTDGVLFRSNPFCKAFKMISGVTRKSSPLDDVIFSRISLRDGALSSEERKRLFRMWFYALFFPELFPTRPILAFIGEKGSGKTSALRSVGQLLFGPDFNVMQLSEDPKDFDAAVTNNSFVAIDNADTRLRWLDDRLAVVATGGKIKKREYYTTNKEVEFAVRAFLGITSRTPQFRRDDVADRLLLFYVQRFEKFLPESMLLAEVQKHRDEIMTEVIHHLQSILRALKAEEDINQHSGFRMADFADFALKISHAEGWGAEMTSILERLVTEQHSFTTDQDPVVDLLEFWLEDEKNVGRPIKSPDLCNELATLAEEKQVNFRYSGNAKWFGQHLTSIMSALREYWTVEDETRGSRKRFLKFSKKREPEMSQHASDIAVGMPIQA